jgi:hypothetical protein
MATLLADSPPAPPETQAQPDGSAGPPATPTPRAHGCSRCGAEMAAGQDWCLQCGAGAPGSLGAPGWRPAATVAGVVLVLVLGAAAAAIAALGKGAAKAPVVTTTVAQAPAPSATTTTTPPAATGSTPAKSALPLGAVKPPKIPLTQSTPKASEKATTTTPSTEADAGTTTTGTTPSSGTGEKTNDESQQAAIELDTDAASTYNPYGYPASEFSGPSLVIDEDPTTAWTAQVNPATAPKMAEGVLLDLKDTQRVAVLQLITSTPGMKVQVYGAKGHTAPESITDPAWKPLSAPKVIKKKKTRFALRDSGKEFTFITLWISEAPQSAVGTATAPGHVAVDEIELFPPKS